VLTKGLVTVNHLFLFLSLFAYGDVIM